MKDKFAKLDLIGFCAFIVQSKWVVTTITIQCAEIFRLDAMCVSKRLQKIQALVAHTAHRQMM